MESRFKATDVPKQTPEERAKWEEYLRELWTVGSRTAPACGLKGK